MRRKLARAIHRHLAEHGLELRELVRSAVGGGRYEYVATSRYLSGVTNHRTGRPYELPARIRVALAGAVGLAACEVLKPDERELAEAIAKVA